MATFWVWKNYVKKFFSPCFYNSFDLTLNWNQKSIQCAFFMCFGTFNDRSKLFIRLICFCQFEHVNFCQMCKKSPITNQVNLLLFLIYQLYLKIYLMSHHKIIVWNYCFSFDDRMRILKVLNLLASFGFPSINKKSSN